MWKVTHICLRRTQTIVIWIEHTGSTRWFRMDNWMWIRCQMSVKTVVPSPTEFLMWREDDRVPKLCSSLGSVTTNVWLDVLMSRGLSSKYEMSMYCLKYVTWGHEVISFRRTGIHGLYLYEMGPERSPTDCYTPWN